jgi:hypothetical protein
MRRIFEEIDSQLESKAVEVIAATFERVRNDSTPRNPDYMHYDAYVIGLEAHETLKNWANRTFTTSPEKEIASAWVNGCIHRFHGPRSMQGEIHQILSNKIISEKNESKKKPQLT